MNLQFTVASGSSSPPPNKLSFVCAQHYVALAVSRILSFFVDHLILKCPAPLQGLRSMRSLWLSRWELVQPGLLLNLNHCKDQQRVSPLRSPRGHDQGIVVGPAADQRLGNDVRSVLYRKVRPP